MTLDKRILDIMKRYMGMLVSKKVLTTMEEVEANTNETNLVAAPVVAELNDKLAGQPEFLYDASGKITGYKTPGGADTVFRHHTFLLLGKKFELLLAHNKHHFLHTMVVVGYDMVDMAMFQTRQWISVAHPI